MTDDDQYATPEVQIIAGILYNHDKYFYDGVIDSYMTWDREDPETRQRYMAHVYLVMEELHMELSDQF